MKLKRSKNSDTINLQPISNEVPNKCRNCLGNITVVELKFIWYTISNGRDARVGKNNLCLHLKSKMSSAKPSNNIQQIESKHETISTNCKIATKNR